MSGNAILNLFQTRGMVTHRPTPSLITPRCTTRNAFFEPCACAHECIATLRDGSYRIRRYGKLHHELGPAVARPDGTELWMQDGRPHRVDGAALNYADGRKEHYIHGYLHNLTGPAIEDPAGRNEWWLNGERVEPFDVATAA